MICLFIYVLAHYYVYIKACIDLQMLSELLIFHKVIHYSTKYNEYVMWAC